MYTSTPVEDIIVISMFLYTTHYCNCVRRGKGKGERGALRGDSGTESKQTMCDALFHFDIYTLKWKRQPAVAHRNETETETEIRTFVDTWIFGTVWFLSHSFCRVLPPVAYYYLPEYSSSQITMDREHVCAYTFTIKMYLYIRIDTSSNSCHRHTYTWHKACIHELLFIYLLLSSSCCTMCLQSVDVGRFYMCTKKVWIIYSRFAPVV